MFTCQLVNNLGRVELQFLAGQSEHFFNDGFCLGALYGKLAVVVALVVKVDIEAFHLLLHPCNILVDIGCIDDKEEIIITHLIDEQVIHGATIGVEHHSIVDLSEGRISHIVREDVLHVALCIRTCDAHFTHVADIKDTTMLAHGVVLIGNVRVLNRHDESAEGRHQGAKCHMAVI